MRNSLQRNEILRIVESRCDHPAAEDIYAAVKKTMPSISLGTVYRNLCVLVENGQVRQVYSSFGGNRYDRTLTNHAHFYCQKCGKITDIEADIPKINSENSILQVDLMYSGICQDCKINHN